MRRSLAVAGLLVSGFALSPSVDAATDPPWTVTELRPLQEGDVVVVNDINEAGTSVGTSGSDAVTWDASGAPTKLEVPEADPNPELPDQEPGDCQVIDVVSISDNGYVAGQVFCGPATSWAVAVWSPDGGLPTVFGDLLYPESIDTNAIVTGWMLHDDGDDERATSSAFASLNGDPLLELPGAGGDQGIAFDHTSWGYVVGAVAGVPGVPQDVAVGWYGDQVFPLAITGLNSAAYAVNEYGVALVGTYREDFTEHRAYLVAPGGRVLALDQGGDADRASDLNDAGIAVGTRVTGDVSDGRFYVGPQSISLAEIVSDHDAAEFGLTRPAAITNAAWVVGSEGGKGWLLKPPA